jgi:hypothetical protein
MPEMRKQKHGLMKISILIMRKKGTNTGAKLMDNKHAAKLELSILEEEDKRYNIILMVISHWQNAECVNQKKNGWRTLN